ncbi:MAG: holo-ACP synthase [Chloroflexota bacterium]
MIHTGIDLVDITRIDRAVRRWGKRFLHRIYTEAELELCRGEAASLAVRFAAKEAVMKLLGTGRDGIGWREIEVLADAAGKPLVKLVGRARRKSRKMKLRSVSVSLSHTREHAIAAVVAED